MNLIIRPLEGHKNEVIFMALMPRLGEYIYNTCIQQKYFYQEYVKNYKSIRKDNKMQI